MKNIDLDRIARNPKFASYKSKPIKRTRTVNDLFEGVEKEISYKDKRGRPWLKNPRAYVRQKIKEQTSKNNTLVDNDSSAQEEEDSSSSDSEEELDPFETIADLVDADWNELTKDAVPATNIGRRLALLHFDWDNAKAENIYMVLESFLPPRGHIERVTIYPSEFGIKRLQEETVKGPPELVDDSSDSSAEHDNASEKCLPNPKSNRTTAAARDTEDGLGSVDVDDKSGWRKMSTRVRRRIRRYQLARLKYFYAIIEFDRCETAEAVYQACDGFEYESTGTRLDLRFVSDEETFSVPPEHAHLVSECRDINKSKYVSRPFETAALHSTRIGITWDKTPDERTCWLKDQFKPESDPKLTLTENRDQLERYLALSSSGASTAASSDVDEPPPAPTVPRVRRHRPKKMRPEELRAALLDTIESQEDTVPPHPEEVEEEAEELVADLGQSSPSSEEYDLGPVEKKSAHSSTAGSGRVRRKILPEAMDDPAMNSSEEDAVDLRETKREQRLKRNKHKEKQRAKIQAKKLKLRERLDKQATLWPHATNPDAAPDDRFDAFLTDSIYRISQTHPDYKEASEFLQYMRERKSLLVQQAPATIYGGQSHEVLTEFPV